MNLPSEVTFKEVMKSKNLSPSTYKVSNVKNKKTLPLSSFFEQEAIQGEEIGSSSYVEISPYKFMRTQAISDEQFNLINDEQSFVPCKKIDFENIWKNNDDNIIRKNDLFYVTGGNVGEVAISNNNLNSIFSSHILKLKIKEKYLYYIFAILKSEIGKKQIEKLPIGSIKGLDSFKKDYLNDIFIPIPNDEENISKIDSIVKEILKKESLIEEKYLKGISLIKEEIEKNQNKKNKGFSMPSYKDLIDETRLDARIYSSKIGKYRKLIKNYSKGYFNNLEEIGYSLPRGQNLQESSIGKSLYSEIKRDNYYRLILSKNIQNNISYFSQSYIGNGNNLKTLKKGDIVFTCRGNMGKVLVYSEEDEKTITNIDNIQITKENPKIEESITIGFYLSYLKEEGIIKDIAIAGSGAGSFTQYHFDKILIPKFDNKFQNQIKEIYDSDSNDKQGIYNLQKEISELKEQLNKILLII